MNEGIRRKRQIRESRLELVAKLYRRGYAMRRIREEVLKQPEYETYSLSTVKSDIDKLLAQWRAESHRHIDEYMTLELARIDEIIEELWSQWERSKEGYTRRVEKRKATPARNAETNTEAIKTIGIERTETDVVNLGDVSYITEIRAQLQERRKLLGLYAPEKSEVKMTEYDLSNLTNEQRAVLLEIGERALNETESPAY